MTDAATATHQLTAGSILGVSVALAIAISTTLAPFTTSCQQGGLIGSRIQQLMTDSD